MLKPELPGIVNKGDSSINAYLVWPFEFEIVVSKLGTRNWFSRLPTRASMALRTFSAWGLGSLYSGWFSKSRKVCQAVPLSDCDCAAVCWFAFSRPGKSRLTFGVISAARATLPKFQGGFDSPPSSRRTAQHANVSDGRARFQNGPPFASVSRLQLLE